MLAALKPQLLAETALEVTHLREKEFKYYEGHISMLQTYATLLAGFAFASFVSVSDPLSTTTLLFKAVSADYSVEGLDQATATIEQKEHVLDPVDMYTFGMHVIEVGSITMCLGENLFVLQVSLAATILGNRLALRGPAGSLNRAIELMARALKRGIDRFVLGLQWFMLSIVFHALKVLHPISSVMVTLIIFSLWNKTHKTIRALHRPEAALQPASPELSARRPVRPRRHRHRLPPEQRGCRRRRLPQHALRQPAAGRVPFWRAVRRCRRCPQRRWYRRREQSASRQRACREGQACRAQPAFRADERVVGGDGGGAEGGSGHPEAARVGGAAPCRQEPGARGATAHRCRGGSRAGYCRAARGAGRDYCRAGWAGAACVRARHRARAFERRRPTHLRLEADSRSGLVTAPGRVLAGCT